MCHHDVLESLLAEVTIHLIGADISDDRAIQIASRFALLGEVMGKLLQGFQHLQKTTTEHQTKFQKTTTSHQTKIQKMTTSPQSKIRGNFLVHLFAPQEKELRERNIRLIDQLTPDSIAFLPECYPSLKIWKKQSEELVGYLPDIINTFVLSRGVARYLPSEPCTDNIWKQMSQDQTFKDFYIGLASYARSRPALILDSVQNRRTWSKGGDRRCAQILWRPGG